MPWLWGLSVISLGSALVFAVAGAILNWRARNARIKCDTCGHKMRKLDEHADNAYLTPSQDMEERLNTVDYDVWVCPQCGTVERFPFRQNQSEYTECPRCHAVAMKLYSDRVIRPATTRQEGLGEKIYRCEYCGHEERRQYRIPRKTNDTALMAAMAAGALLGGGRGGRGGGGGFGGGFGGGMSGGGGASGGW